MKTKILFLSDIHIRNYQTYSQKIDNIITNRLHLFQYLADDIMWYAEQHNVGIIVVGGDVLDKATSTPEELSYARYFLDKLSSNAAIDLVCIVGNHDISMKTNEWGETNAVVSSIMPRRDNVHYAEREQVFAVKGISFHCHSWTLSNEINYAEHDILVCHGPIQNCKNADGWTFTKGFKTADLYEHYNVTLAGDIHMPFLFESESTPTKYAIQSGTLHQNSHGDSAQAGFWVFDFNSTTKEVSKPEFVHNNTLPHAEHYYSFSTVDELPNERVINRPMRLLPQKKQAVKVTKDVTATNLQDKFAQVVQTNNLDSAYIDLFNELYLNTASTAQRVPCGIMLKGVKINNFLSIVDYEHVFQDVENVLILGETGHGKTTLLSAVYFALTGTLTADSSENPELSELPNWHHQDKMLKVELDFCRGSEKYAIIRTCTKGKSVLDLLKDGNSIRRNSIKETQEEIYNLIGCDREELFSFTYHSVLGNTSFADMKNADKYNIISKLSHAAKVDDMRDALKEKTSQATTLKSSLDGGVAELERLIKDKKERHNKIITARDSSQINVADVQAQVTQLDTSVAALIESRHTAQQATSALNNKKQQLQLLNTQIAQCKQDYTRVFNKHQALKNGTCNECGQSHVPSDVESQLATLEAKLAEVTADGKAKRTQIAALEADIATCVVAPFNNQILLNQQAELTRLKQLLASNDSLIQAIAQLDYIKAECTTMEADLVTKQAELKLVVDKVLLYKEMVKLLDKKSEFIGALLNDACEMLNRELDYVCCDISDFNVRLEMDKEIKVFVDFAGKDGIPLTLLSAGQRKLTEVALLVAFINTYCNMFQLDKGLLGFVFLDEIFQKLSLTRLEQAKLVVDKCIANRIVITHENSLQNMFQHILVAEYSDWVTTYVSL